MSLASTSLFDEKEPVAEVEQMLREQGYATAMMGKWHVGLTFLDMAGQRITQGIRIAPSDVS